MYTHWKITEGTDEQRDFILKELQKTETNYSKLLKVMFGFKALMVKYPTIITPAVVEHIFNPLQVLIKNKKK